MSSSPPEAYPHEPYRQETPSPAESLAAAESFRDRMATRRSLRFFSEAPVAREVVDAILQTASSAPSGAHKQPWTFCAVADRALKAQIRVAAEREEFASYSGRMSEEWLADLAPLGTDWRKPFLEVAPWLIVVFRQAYGVGPAGERRKHYYVNESVGLASGFLLAAVHAAGLVALTHTPSPMNFLTELLGRPDNEKPFLLIPIGYPAADATVPALRRKSLEEVAVYFESSEQ